VLWLLEESVSVFRVNVAMKYRGADV